MSSVRVRLINAGYGGLVLVFFLVFCAPPVALGAWNQKNAANVAAGARLHLDDYTVWASADWKKLPWKKKGKHRGWRLHHQPEGMTKKQIRLSLSLAAKPTQGASLEEIFAEQDRMLHVIKNNYPDGFLAQNMMVAGQRALILRYYDDGSTIFILFPYTRFNLYEIYVWVDGEVQSLPHPAEALLKTLTLPGQTPYEPAASGEAVARQPDMTPAPAQAPVSPPPAPAGSATVPSPVGGVCYVADRAAAGQVLDIKLGMPKAHVEKSHKIIGYQTGSYRLWEEKNPCLANYEYRLAPKGFKKEETSHAVVFEVDTKNPAEPVKSIEAKIVCEPGIDLSRRLFAWYAKAYGPPEKSHKMDMDATMKLGSRVISAEYWHTWHFKSAGDRPPMSLQIKRRNHFEYYTITLKTQ